MSSYPKLHPTIVPDDETTATDAKTASDQPSTETLTEDQQLDADEIALRALRIDLPGVADAPTGIVSIAVSGRFPKHEFFRVHPEHTMTIYAVTHEVGMDTEFYAMKPEMVQALAAIGIDAMPHRLYTLITAEGVLRLVLVRQADLDGSQNEWNYTKENTLKRARDEWVRAVSDRVNKRWRAFPAPTGRFADPIWPDLTLAQLVKLAFTERGRLIENAEHPLFKKWAALDA